MFKCSFVVLDLMTLCLNDIFVMSMNNEIKLIIIKKKKKKI